LCIVGLCSFIVVPRLLSAATLVVFRMYLIIAPGRCPRRRTCSCAWRPGRCPSRRPLCVAGTYPCCLGRCLRRCLLFFICTKSWCLGRCRGLDAAKQAKNSSADEQMKRVNFTRVLL
jgi:hypothetical protein